MVPGHSEPSGLWGACHDLPASGCSGSGGQEGNPQLLLFGNPLNVVQEPLAGSEIAPFSSTPPLLLYLWHFLLQRRFARTCCTLSIADFLHLTGRFFDISRASSVCSSCYSASYLCYQAKFPIARPQTCRPPLYVYTSAFRALLGNRGVMVPRNRCGLSLGLSTVMGAWRYSIAGALCAVWTQFTDVIA